MKKENVMVNICFIGAGEMANKVHYPSLASFNDVKLTGICDLNASKREKTAKKYNVPFTYDDYKKMIHDLKPDGVYVIAPPQHMYDIVKWCISEKIPTFCEKPLGLTYHQTQMLTDLAIKNEVITQVGHQRRSSPILNKVLKESKLYGAVTHAICEFYKYDLRPLYDASDHLHDDGSHSIDTLRWICGGEVVGVESQVKRIGTPDINWVYATLFFDNGSTGIMVNNWASGRRVFRVEVHAPGFCSDVELENKAIIYSKGNYEGDSLDCKEVARSEEFHVYGGFLQKSREFIDSIITSKEVTSSPFHDVLKTMEVVETVIAQSIISKS